MSDRRRTAFHEAAHAVAAVVLGRPVTLVSIRPGAAYGGITMMEVGADFVFTGSIDQGVPVVLQPPRLRASLEAEIVISLAGPVAGHYAELASGYVASDPCESAAEEAVTDLAHLSPRHRELVATKEARRDSFVDDETAASTLSWALIGEPSEATAHLTWLRAVASNLAQAHWFRIEALAAALLEHTVLDGHTATSIVTNAIRQEVAS